MATFTLFILGVTFLCAQAFPNPPVTRNTIFLDEKLEDQIFEYLNENEVVEYNTASSYRLPTTTRPTNYKVRWDIDLATFYFRANVVITVVANQANVSNIVINSHDLRIESVILQQNARNIPVTFTLNPDLQLMTIQSSETLQYNQTNPVQYTLTINTVAELRNDMYGIYRSWYRNNPGEPVSWMASTQFQATSARAAFPCYDEPSFKATFDITIRRSNQLKSWSLTNAQTQPFNTTHSDDVYETTPLMSTYLLALIVADYASIRTPATGQLQYEVIARPHAISTGQGSYALATGEKLVNEMNNHTNISYFSMHNNIKMTHAAVPDFSAGAMENWGLITYREAYLMYTEDNTNDNFKQIIAYILSHEIAHMWFGNMVTCEFWDSLWLNEGFARYYQYFLTNWVEKDMGFETRFITEQVHTALLADSAESAHPLTNPNIGSPSSISGMFSTISYNKGAAIIRMTEHLLGTSVHTEGLRLYLRAREFKTAQPIDLFNSLQQAGIQANAFSQYGDFSFVDYYKSWTEYSGHPILYVNVDHASGNMVITQRRFSINDGYANNNRNYIIPITFATQSNPDFSNLKPSHILKDTVTIINRTSIGDEWVIFNKQQSGFYRVNYDDYTWDLIILALRSPARTAIHEYNRAQIVNDVFQFARSGIMPYSRAFNILSFLEFETDYAPWVAAMTGFSWLRNRLAADNALLSELERIIATWSANVMSQLTYDPIPNESFMSSYLRFQLAPVLCSINVPACRQAATNQFRALIDNGVQVPVNNRNWVYCNGLRGGTVNDFNALWQRYENINVYTEKILLLQNFGCTPHETALNTFLDNIFNDNFVIRPQDYSSAFNSAVTGNEGNTQIVFRYIQSNLQKVIQAFGSVQPIINVASRLRSEAEINAFQTWATQNQEVLGSNLQNVINNAEVTRESLQWVATVRDELNRYFQTGNENVTTTTSTTPAPAPTMNVTTSPIQEPSTPVIPPTPDSAVTTTLSALALIITIIVNVIA